MGLYRVVPVTTWFLLPVWMQALPVRIRCGKDRLAADLRRRNADQNWLHPRRLHCWINPKKQPNAAGHAQTKKDHAHRNVRREINHFQQEADAQREHDADGAAQSREGHGFRDELEADIAFAGANGLADADLTRALGHAHEHDVHYAHAADQQSNGADANHQTKNAGHDLGELFACLFRAADAKIVGLIERHTAALAQQPADLVFGNRFHSGKRHRCNEMLVVLRIVFAIAAVWDSNVVVAAADHGILFLF